MPLQKKVSKTIYQGRDIWVNQRTGEVVEADQVIKKVDRTGFEITYLMYFMELFDKLGGQKYKVVKYILENRSKAENTLIITTEELAKKSKVSRQTVSDALKIMEDANLIKRRTGAIMVNAQLVHRGSVGKERYLMQKFEVFEKENVEE